MIFISPYLHAELISNTPGGMFLLDPGVDAPEAVIPRFRPALPLSPAQGKALVAEWMAYGMQFSKAGDMTAQSMAVQALQDSNNPGAFAIESQLTALEKSPASPTSPLAQSAPEDQNQRDEQLRAQTTLLLMWAMEARLLELRELQDGVVQGEERFLASLGVDDPSDLALVEMGKQSQADPVAEIVSLWPRTLWAMATLAPEGSFFYIDDRRIEADAIDLGASFALVDPETIGSSLPDVLAGSVETAVLCLGDKMVTLIRPARG